MFPEGRQDCLCRSCVLLISGESKSIPTVAAAITTRDQSVAATVVSFEVGTLCSGPAAAVFTAHYVLQPHLLLTRAVGRGAAVDS